ncbi:SRPBCC family protein [Bernardetia sp. ABR2-2B]|uniref:SRPBCC family protein n=1 Tax=Bernardetia sp. ABR2-2B TaxID=3127472 RepID=UPI0030CD2E96
MSNIAIQKQIEINASAKEVWNILANDYENVGKWATIIPESAARKDHAGKVAGRTCSSSYGDVQEMITEFDEKNMQYAYKADGLSAMFKEGGNVWNVKSKGENTSLVTMNLKMKMNPVMGLLMGWMIKPKMNKDTTLLMEDLKYYVETGNPHPRKIKSVEKWNKQKAKKK